MSLELEALQALIGAASLSTEEARAILDDTRVTAEDVTHAPTRTVWQVVEARIRRHEALDAVGITQAVRGDREANAVAAAALAAPALGVARERLTLLRDAGVRRRLVEALRVVAVDAKAGKPLAQLDAAVREVPRLLQGAGTRVRNASGDSLKILDRLESSWQGRSAPRLMLGLGELDEALGGLIANLYVVGARPGVGKSALVAGLVKGWASNGVRVGVCCYEDDAVDLQMRIVAAYAGVPLKAVRGDVPANEWQRRSIGEALEWWHSKEHLLEVDDARPSGSPADLLASLRTMADRGCRVRVLDNMTGLRLDGDDERHEAIGDVLRDLRDEAQHSQLPSFIVGHLKRGQDAADESQKPPRPSDFSASGAWENFARVMLGMWRGSSGPMLRVLKQTNGVAGQDFELTMQHEAAVITGAKLAAAPTQDTGRPTRYDRRRTEMPDVD